MQGIIHRAVAWFVTFVVLPAAVLAQVPQLLNYQGRLVSGTNLVSGSVGLSLLLFDAPSGGALLFEDSNTVTVADGLYATFIGDDPVTGDLTAALDAPAVYVEAEVDGVTAGCALLALCVAG